MKEEESKKYRWYYLYTVVVVAVLLDSTWVMAFRTRREQWLTLSMQYSGVRMPSVHRFMSQTFYLLQRAISAGSSSSS